MPFAFFLGWSTILIEVVGGLLILCGAFVPLASAPMIVVLLVAIFTVHLPNGFSSIKLIAYDGSGAHFGQPGYETDLLYLAALLALCFGGAGPLSLDGYVSARRTVRAEHASGTCRQVRPHAKIERLAQSLKSASRSQRIVGVLSQDLEEGH